MPAHAYSNNNKVLTSNYPNHMLPSLMSSGSSSSSETIITIVFGLCASAIGIITIWQSRKAWKIWHATYGHMSHVQGDPSIPAPDLELGHTAPAASPAPEQDPSSTGAVAGSPAPLPDTETSRELDEAGASSQDPSLTLQSSEATTTQHVESQGLSTTKQDLSISPDSANVDLVLSLSMPPEDRPVPEGASCDNNSLNH